MGMERVSARASSSSALAVSVGDATSCSPLQISWSASSGTAPWTIMIAPINETPITIAVPTASGSNFQYNWTAPNYSSKSSTQAFVSIADSSGSYSGVSSLFSFGPSTQTCDAPDISLDFVWYPTSTAGLPEECTDWGITWQKDAKDNGIEGDVTYTFLPENGKPITVSGGTSSTKGGNFKYTIPWSAGTNFAVVANDEGVSGTGGVGDLYTVTAGGKACSSSTGNIGNGLPAASTTAAASASTSASASVATSATKSSAGKAVNNIPSASSTSITSGDNSSKDNSAAGTSADATKKTGQSHAGAAVGATFGVLAVIAIVVGLFWYLRKRKAARANELSEKNSASNYPISPWRFSSSPFDDPVTTSRSSKWFGKGNNTKGFGMIGEGGSRHGVKNSISTSFKGPLTTAHNRHPSSFSQATSASSPIGQSPFETATFHNVVPDTALFPPLRQHLRSESNEGLRSPDSIGPPMGGMGAGVGTFDSISRQDTVWDAGKEEQKSPIAPSGIRRKPVGSKREFEKYPAALNASSSSNNKNEPVGPSEPTMKGVYEPQTHHLSQISEDRNSVKQEIQRIDQQQHHQDSGDLSNITSEVMMHHDSLHSQSDVDRTSRHSDEMLPYL
ncbi:hypothetical protein CBS101457_002149 [Exobasidium rhododendri]|nr:hypothetical protein CBS101457_002149 [Exobasidium rhododendri]